MRPWRCFSQTPECKSMTYFSFICNQNLSLTPIGLSWEGERASLSGVDHRANGRQCGVMLTQPTDEPARGPGAQLEPSSQSLAGRELTAGELLRGARLVGAGWWNRDSEKVWFCEVQTLLFTLTLHYWASSSSPPFKFPPPTHPGSPNQCSHLYYLIYS